jgi:glucose/mannose-6-phosphate isomerase
MDLNNIQKIKEIDTQNMLSYIDGLPDQLLNGWQSALKQELPNIKNVNKVVIAGMGGSAIGGEILSAYIKPFCTVPVLIHSDYQLPEWAKSKDTLLICSSHSGNTEEVLSVYEDARSASTQVISITTGGKLAEYSQRDEKPYWKFDIDSQPRAAVGFSFSFLLALFFRLGFIPDPTEDLKTAISDMKIQQAHMKAELADSLNPAKRTAGQFLGRWLTIFGGGIMTPVAKRWKTQINENAKSQANYEILPEANHNTLQGIFEPSERNPNSITVFLRASENHPRLKLRDEFTQMTMMVEGHNVTFNFIKGSTVLSQIWNGILLGDYISFYMAIAYELDPTPVPMLVELKKKLSDA